jgi:prepilin-type N-terminal cleavage/methylation domain-containing protein
LSERHSDSGFTLAELMVVVLVISLLLAIAVPIYLNSSTAAAQRTCWANQREVDVAWQTYRASSDSSATIAVWSDLMSELVPDYLKAEPECPRDGMYLWDGSESDCTIPDHAR